MNSAAVSLNDLDAAKASETPFEFNYVKPDGTETAIKLRVLGGQSEKVTQEVARLVNDRRRKEAVRLAQVRVGNKRAPEFETLESDVEFGQRLAAVRLVGWTGINEPWSEENALRLCKSNRHLAAQVAEQSEALENFMPG